MSNVVDERVVEMRFDNKQFESNVKTSMSTLDKLKEKLNLSGAAKGLENIDSATKKIDMNGLGNSISTVTARFSALQVAGMTAISNITTSVMSLGKRMVSAISTDPIKDGMTEYETQMNAVQTILANTQKEGTTVKTVNAALDELNHYADKTIYNFTEMTRNIGTFTAAGVKLDTSVNAIQGIANLAAVSGSNSQQASTAMYQLSQALAAGTVKLMDWNSVVNAGMGGQMFQDALTETSEKLQTGAKAAIEAKGSFRESLQTGWLTSEVLTETLKKFTTSGATEYVAEYTGLSKEAVDATLEQTDAWGKNADAIDKAAEALASQSGKSKDEIKNALQFAKTAEDAATKVKTFRQLIDTLKEALGSGWTETWRLIIGDFEEAKDLWTSVNDVLSPMIDAMSEARNKLIDSAMKKSFDDLKKKLTGITEPAQNAIKAVNDLGDVVNKVIRGDFGNGKERFDALTAAGQNYYAVQNKVNETLGCAYRYTEEQIKAQDKVVGTTTAETEATAELSDEKKQLLKDIAKMSEAQMKEAGYSKEQIAAFKELKDTAEKLGMPVNELIDNLDQITGRWILIDSFKNIGTSLITTFSAIGKAWHSIFTPMSADTLFNIIAGFHKLTASVKNFTSDNADNLTRTFKGLFAALDLIRRVVGGGLMFAIKAVNGVLKAFDTNILEVTGKVGDAIVAFRSFVLSNDLVTQGFMLLGKGLKYVADALARLFNYVKQLPQVQKFLKDLSKIDLSKLKLGDIKKYFTDAFKDVDLVDIGLNIIAGLKNGLSQGIHIIPGVLVQIGTSLVSAIKGVLGIHSPSTVMFEVGNNIILGLLNGLKTAAKKVYDWIKSFGSNISKDSKGIKWNKVFAVAGLVGVIYSIKKFGDLLERFSAPFVGVEKVLASASEFMDSFQKDVKRFSKALSFNLRTEGIKNLAISLGILTASVYVLSKLKVEELSRAVTTIAFLAGILVALSYAMNKLESSSIAIDKEQKRIDFSGMKTGLVGIGTALLLMAMSIKMIGKLNPDQFKQGMEGMVGAIAAMAVVFAALGFFVKGKTAKNIDKAGVMLKKMATAMLIMAVVVKIVGGLSMTAMIKGAGFAVAFTLFALAMAKISTIGDKSMTKLGSMLLKMSIAMGLMVGVVKLAGHLSPEEMIKGAAFAAGFVLFVLGLRKAVSINKGTEMAKLSGMLLSLSIAMGLMVGVVKLVGLLKPSEMAKGAGFAAAFLLFTLAITAISKYAGKGEMAKLGGTLLAMSVALGIMVGVVKLASMLSIGEMLKGGLAVTAFVAMMIAMIKAIKTVGPDAPKMATTLIAMSVSVGILAGICVLMSFVKPEALVKGIAAVGALSVFMTLMIAATKGATNCMKNLLAISAAIVIMAAAVFLLSGLDQKQLIGATACLVALMGMFALITKAAGTVKQSFGTLAVMILVVAALAGIIYALNKVGVDSSLKTALSLSVLLMALSKAVQIVAKNAPIATSAMVAMGVMVLVVAALAVILYKLQGLPIKKTLSNAVALSTMMLALATSIKIISTIKSVSKSAILGMAGLTVIMGGVGLILGLLNKFNFHASMKDVEALSVVMIALSTAALILSKVGPTAELAIPGAAGLLAVLGVAGLIFGVVGGIIGAIPKARKFIEDGIPVLQALGEGIGSFFGGIVGGFMSASSDGLVKVGENLTKFVSSFSGVDSTALTGVKTMVDIIMEITAAGLLDKLASFVIGKSSMEKFAENIEAFGEAMNSFANSVSGLSPLDMSKIAMITTLGKGLSELQSTIAPVGGILQAFTGVQDLGNFGMQISEYATNLNTAASAVATISADGMTNLSAIAEIGQAFAALQNNIGYTSGLVTVLAKKDLGAFATEIVLYAIQLKIAAASVAKISADGLNNLGSIATIGQAFAELRGNIGYTSGLVTWLKNNNLGAFGGEIKKYATNLNDAAKAVEKISATGLTNLGNLTDIGTAFDKLKTTLTPTSGLINEIKEHVDLGDFGEEISKYATNLKSASDSLTGGNAINQDAIDAAINDGKLLSELQKALPETHWFDGKYDLAEFGTKISLFGGAMGQFGDSVGDVDTGKMSTAISIANRLRTFAEGLEDFNGDGITKFAGDGYGGTTGVGGIGSAISNFTSSIGDFDVSLISNALAIGTRLKSFARDMSGIDTDNIDDFGSVSDIGSAIGDYAANVGTFDPKVVLSSITVAQRLKGFVATLGTFKSDGIKNFEVDSLGDALKKYSESVINVNAGSVSNSVSAAITLRDFISSLTGLDTSGVSKFKSSITQLATSNVSKLASTFNSSTEKISSAGKNMTQALSQGLSSSSSSVTKEASSLATSVFRSVNSKSTQFIAAGKTMVSNLAKGIKGATIQATSAGRTLAISAANAMAAGRSLAVQYGNYIGQGFVVGIMAQAQACYNAGAHCADMSKKGFKDHGGINSPSKYTRQYGVYMGEGFVLGMESMNKAVYNAGGSLSDAATQSISGAIAQVSDLINTGIDSTPTIRPVVDLSNVESQASMIGSMFDSPMVQPMSNIRAIRTMMDERNQNGVNDEVVSAINKLRKDLGNTGNTYNSINGINVGDDAAVNDAMGVLLRTAKLDRRS